MSHLVEIALPFVNKNLTYDDIAKDTGFVDAFFYDINKPYKDHHFFMLYDLHREKGDAVSRAVDKLNHLNNLYDWRVIYVNKHPYVLYSFTTNKVIEDIKKGFIPTREKQKFQLDNFWRTKNYWIFDNIIVGGTSYYEPDEKDEVPEEDYMATDKSLNPYSRL